MERLLVVFTVLVLAVACDSPGGPGGTADEDYFPFTTGSNWQYDRLGEIDTLGIQYSVSGGTSVSVASVTAMEGYDLVHTVSVGYDTLYGEGVDSLFIPLAGNSFLRLDDDGVWQYTDSTMTDSFRIARFPLTVGDTWEYLPEGSGSVSGEAEVISLDETVTVPEGTFQDVLHIRYTVEAGVVTTMDRWFGPGTGLLRTETQVTAGGGPAILYDMTEDLVGHLVLPGDL